MSQLSFASLPVKRKSQRTSKFLTEMDRSIPWKSFIDLIRPYYYSGERGRKPMSLELMLRIYFLQQWYHLGDPSVEEEIYDRFSFQKFLRIDIMNDNIPQREQF